MPDGENATLPDINLRELGTVVPLLALSLFLGIYPKPVIDRVQPSVQALICHVEQNTHYKQPMVAFGGGTVAAKRTDPCAGVKK